MYTERRNPALGEFVAVFGNGSAVFAYVYRRTRNL